MDLQAQWHRHEEGQCQGARVCAPQERAGTGRATRHAMREVVFGPMRGQRAFLGWGVKRHRQQQRREGSAHLSGSLCWWPQLTTVAGCENWRQSDEAVKFHYPSNGDGCRRKSAKGPARCTHQGFALEMYQHSVLNSPTPIFRTRLCHAYVRVEGLALLKSL